jgi:2-iminoacetate synthase
MISGTNEVPARPRETPIPGPHDELDARSFHETLERARGATREDALAALGQSPLGLEGAASLLSVPREDILEELLVRSHAVTESRFHRTVLVLAPCYVSSFCANGCVYCRFNVEESPARRWISPRKAGEEVAALAARGFRRVVLVAGDLGSALSPQGITEVVAEARRHVPEVDLAVGAARESQYRTWNRAGAQGVTCYQETYDRAVYAQVHPSGPKSRYDRRLAALEMAGRAGMSRLGLGVLLGLADPMADLLALIFHARRLGRLFPDARLTVALPRLEPDVLVPVRRHAVPDEELLRLMGVLRLALPDAGLIDFPREPEWMRGRLLTAGVTHMTSDAGPGHGRAFVECLHDDGEREARDDRRDLELTWDLEDLGYRVVRDEGGAGGARARAANQGTGRAM